MKRIFLLAAAAIALTGCVKTETDNVGGNGNNFGALAYDPAEVVTITTDGGATRGIPIADVSQMTDMGAFCSYTGQDDWTAADAPNKMFDVQLERNTTTGAWEYTGTPVKWNPALASDRFTFFAYAPYAMGVYNSSTNSTGNGIEIVSASTDGGIPTLRYTVPSAVALQPDLMVAVPQKNLRHTGNPVRLQMEHALTCVGFQVAGTGEKIKQIAIRGVSVSETLSMDGGTIVWSATGAKTTADFTASINFDDDPDNPGGKLSYFTATEDMSGMGARPNFLASNGYLMMIPQTLGEDAKIVLTMSDDSTTEIGLDGYSWTAGKRVNYIITLVSGGGSITVTPQTLLLPYLGVNHLTDNIEVICSDNDGNPAPAMAWTLTTADDWLTLTLNSTGTGAAQTVSGTGSRTVYTVATENTSTTNTRTTTITLNGTTDEVCTAVQLKKVTIDDITGGGTLPSAVASYVGAFWRKDQTGERVIKIDVGTRAANLGAWTASVVWMDANWSEGDIMLSAEAGESDSILYTDAPGDAEDYQVTSGLSTVGGTVTSDGSILFRIGLKTKWSEHANYDPENRPARYAVLLLSYNNYEKHQKIFLRQGEEADYVMRPGDNGITTADITERPEAKPLLPYNLTTPNLSKIANSPYYDNTVLFEGGALTSYPSQLGAHWQLASSNKRFAYSPVVGSISGVGASSTSWNTTLVAWSSDQETCPHGYRRPKVGTQYFKSNEWFQSLVCYENNVADNSVYGMYADGYYDRRERENPPQTIGYEVIVCKDDVTVGSIGLLFFNPLTSSQNYNASIFIPIGLSRAWKTSKIVTSFSGAPYMIDNLLVSMLRSAFVHISDVRVSITATQDWQGNNGVGFIRCVKNVS